MNLQALQSWMQEAVLRPGTLIDAEQHIAPGGHLSSAEALGIYQRSYALRLLACMRQQFPALAHALGEGLFDDFAAEYLRDLPSDTWTLHELGRRFAGYLEAARPDADAPEAWGDFMIDLARFEREIFVVFDAPGNEGADYADHTTPDADLRLQRGFRLVSSRFPVATFYHGVKDATDPAIPAPSPSFVALVRRDYQVRTIPVTPMQHAFLRALQAGADVEQALAQIAVKRGVSKDQMASEWRSEESPRRAWLDAGFFVAADHGALPSDKVQGV